VQHLNTLTELANAVSTVAEIARHTQTYRFAVNGAITLYMDADSAEVRVLRRPDPSVEVTASLQAPFAWRIVTDQDEAGVYVVARRRLLVGAVAAGSFLVSVPPDAYLVLKLKDCRLSLEAISGTIELPANNAITLA
jgi:hypothetical protein